MQEKEFCKSLDHEICFVYGHYRRVVMHMFFLAGMEQEGSDFEF